MALSTPGRRLPIPEDIRDFLGDLLGVSVAVDKRSLTASTSLPSERSWVSARYVDDHGVLVGACIADLPLAASAGAALAMIPATAASEGVAAGRLEGALRDNFHEVVSVVSAMLNVISEPHLRLADVVDGVPHDVAQLMAQASAHKQYDVTIVGQAGGTLALIGI
ncbi:MAG: hypothetical protein JWN99_227 [Ilumatobacteraceae bacterium]|nr:hypothetical protein [Ilumatobacteraceae bacterium]